MKGHAPWIRLCGAVMVVFIAALIASCSDMVSFDRNDPGHGAGMAGFSMFSDDYTDDACGLTCIEAGEGPYLVASGTETSRQGINTKRVSYRAYNTEDLFVVSVTYEITAGRSNAHATIIIDIDGAATTFEKVAKGATVVHQVDLPEGWQACDEVAYSIRQEGLGRPVEFSGSYALIPVCPSIQPVLWNRLSSPEHVANSEIGPFGTIVGHVNFNNTVKFGQGITPNSGRALDGVDFPTTVADPERGAVEMWTKFYDDPRAYSHGVYGFINANHWMHNVLSFTWYNGGGSDRGYLQFVMQFNGPGRHINYRPFEPVLNEPVHLAIVWDRGGIDGSSDYMRIYVNGDVVAANSEQNDWGTDNTAGDFRVATTWDRNFGTDRYSVENLKVWDFAKTDFSDRFTP